MCAGTFVDGPLLFRSGGYWWDGTAWYRPLRVFDWAGEDYFRRAVRGASSVTAAGILAAGAGDPARGSVLDIATADPAAPYGAGGTTTSRCGLSAAAARTSTAASPA